MSYSIEHARVKEAIEKSQCTGPTPLELLHCLENVLRNVGYTPTTSHLLDANVDPAEQPERARFIRIETQKAGEKNTHIFTFAILKSGGIFKALWLQSAVVER
ncbi:hypothetical protein Pogu_0579 [Pyrobaculum oguniense TE7]|uniref:Uncharacterized protein n=1 Tax=Pyrobaculum oguniense (strain DSM 13380 / JCM 10595 / TE7) TaxID=698757 RepID=H6Q7U9_PYROT|nr:hypothetical protein Pogu_0579 [Pyrobaculum oguniense TE7]